MGKSASTLWKTTCVLAAIFCDSASAIDTEPVCMMVGISGHGKSTIISNLCDHPLKTGHGKDSTTTYEDMEHLIPCGGQSMFDSVGMMDIPPGENIENAMHRGLIKLLSFLDGKNIGRIYLVVSSSYMKDYGRLLEQVDRVQSLVSPLIPWTLVVNCYEGVCPTDKPKSFGPKHILSLLKEKIGHSIEVRAPHEQPVDKSLFPVPTTVYPINLPEGWRDMLADLDYATIRERMKAEAIAKCSEHSDAYQSASRSIQDYKCSIPLCPEETCPNMGACPSSDCDLPLCANTKTCDTKETTKETTLVGVGSSVTHTTTGVDSECLQAITGCNTARSDQCIKRLAMVTECQQAQSEECLKHQASAVKCNTQRSLDCDVEITTAKESYMSVMELHKPYVDDCQKFYML